MYSNEINVAGFHFHATTADTMAGGHVLDCEAGDVEVEFDFTNQLQVKFDHGKRPAFRALIQGETNRPMTIGRSILIGERLTVVRTFYT